MLSLSLQKHEIQLCFRPQILCSTKTASFDCMAHSESDLKQSEIFLPNTAEGHSLRKWHGQRYPALTSILADAVEVGRVGRRMVAEEVPLVVTVSGCRSSSLRKHWD